MREDWIEVTLNDIAKWGSGGTPKSTVNEYYNGSIPWLVIGDLNDGYISASEKSITEAGLKNSSAKIVNPNSILIAMYGSIGKLGINKIPVTTNQAIAFTEQLYELANNKYLFYYLLFSRSKLYKLGKGGTQRNISQTVLKKVDFPLPPLPEQRAIVAKIEQLFSELDNGIANFKAAKAKLDIYRQAVLKKAFEGELEDNNFIISEITEKIQIGPFGSQLHQEDYIEDGIPLINPMHIQNGKIQANTSYSISIEKRDSLSNYIIKNGDVIMGRRGEMGRCGLVTMKEEGWFCGTGSLYFRPNLEKVYPTFLYYYLRSPIVKELLTGNAAGTTMKNLNKKIVSNIPINLPCIQNQNQIVQEIESRLSVCDKLATTIDESLAKAEALRQSILKKAFEGKLLSEAELYACRQEPDWEPAAQLLERIHKKKESGRSSEVRQYATTGNLFED